MSFSLFRRYFIAAGLLSAAMGLCQAAVPPTRTLLVLGDSLSAEYGLSRGSGWVALLAQRLAHEKQPVKVVNASISGETTFGGRSRLPALLAQHKPSWVIIELGANDALRGLALDATRNNLAWMTKRAQQSGARVLLLGMQLPPNYGRDYSLRFADLYAQVARANRASLVPFFLTGVADEGDALHLFQADRIHPNEQAQPRMLDNVWTQLTKLL